MWITIETTTNYVMRARTVQSGPDVLGCMLVVMTTPGNELAMAQFIPGYTAEQIQAGW